MILQVLIHIENGELLAVETGQEHIHNEKDVQRFSFLALHSVRNVLVICGEGISGEIGAVLLVIVRDDTLKRVTAMLILALGILVLSVGENAGDVQVMLDLLEDVIILDKSLNRRYCKDSGVLTVSCFCFMVLNNMVCDQRHSLFGEIEFTHINSIGKSRIIPIKIALHRLDVLNMETENIVIKDSVLDQIVMYALTEEHFGCLRDFALRFTIYLKTRRSGKAKELCFLEVTNDVLVHIAKLTAVTFVDDKDYLLVSVRTHELCILRTLDGICHLLHRRNDELPVLILHLLHKNIGAIRSIN